MTKREKIIAIVSFVLGFEFAFLLGCANPISPNPILTIHLVDQAGLPMPDILVTVVSADLKNVAQTSDKNGVVSFSLPKGTYDIHSEWPSDQPQTITLMRDETLTITLVKWWMQ